MALELLNECLYSTVETEASAVLVDEVRGWSARCFKEVVLNYPGSEPDVVIPESAVFGGGEEYSWLLNGDNTAPPTGLRICVIGGGFVGLVTAACMAQSGHDVTCVEKDTQKLVALREGRTSLYERNLLDILRANVKRNRLHFTSDISGAVSGQHVLIVSVGTPSDGEGRADLSALQEVFETLSGLLDAEQIVVIKSTVPVGTAQWAKRILNERDGRRKPIAVVSNPEFLREGTAVYDYFHPQRIVVGGDSPTAVDKVVQMYHAGLATPAPIVITSSETAEMIKYASNVYLAMRVAFVNELSGVCDAFGIDIGDVSSAMGLDPRIGSEYLEAGPGFGGSCLPKDLSAYVADASKHGVEPVIAQAVGRANEVQLRRVVEKAAAMAGGSLKDRRIGILGLAFKAHTNDLRDSPAVHVIKDLLRAGAEVHAFDPAAMGGAEALLPGVHLCDSAESVAHGADAVIILTEWPEFQLIDWAGVRDVMRQPNIVDARNLVIPESVKRLGFRYVGMGQR